MKNHLLVVLCAALLIGATASSAMAQSAKATAMVSDVTLVNWTPSNGWATVLKNTLKTANQKDLFIDVALQCGLYTQTLAASKGGVKDTSTAQAQVEVRVLIDGVEADPGIVVFERRMQQLSAKLEGMIADALTLVDTNGDGIPDSIYLNPDLVTIEEIELIQETLSANSFNFVSADVLSGTHTIEVQARVDSATTTQNGSASARAMIGMGGVTVESVRMVKDDPYLLD